jgi:LysM repeat protein
MPKPESCCAGFRNSGFGLRILFSALELYGVRFYRRPMKRISILLAASALFTTPVLRAQDAATEERLNKLAGRIEDLTAGQEALGKRIEALGREVESLRSAMDKPTGNYAGQEDVKHLAEAVKEIDRKRLDDYDKIKAELLKLQKSLTAPVPPSKKTPPPGPTDNGSSEKPSAPDKGYEYIVKKGDTLSIIVQAYRDNNIKVNTDQILKANPGLKAEKLRVGQKIFIPAPQS